MLQEVAATSAQFTERGLTPPTLAVLVVGDATASASYLKSQAKGAAEAMVTLRQITLPEAATSEEVASVIGSLNDDGSVDGILVQLPFPPGLPTAEIINQIAPAKDVDGLTYSSLGALSDGGSTKTGSPHSLSYPPCTPAGCLELLRREDVPLRGAEAVVIGASKVVGVPMALMLSAEGAKSIRVGLVGDLSLRVTCHKAASQSSQPQTKADFSFRRSAKKERITYMPPTLREI